VLEIAPPFGAIALGLAFIAFPRLLKKPIEGWLFGNETEQQLRGEPQDKEEKTP
jgi:hypothetical protein